ncbi:ABC transporter ATP-binding protein [Alteribacillus sp. HJP-4]|uniref:ABC transporter ATP-binding protein n=1 Tax=Alteribacillus sp. HJP-4 TaxID=2775394 RepID=UPI0035CD3BF6
MLSLRNVDKVYVTMTEAAEAVSGISFDVQQGEFVSLIGPSGCGKTTILSMIAGLMVPTKGEILLHGNTVKGPSRQTGYMLQQDYLFPWLTIQQNAELGLRVSGALTSSVKEHVQELLVQMKLKDRAKSYPAELSGGMRQRAALVRVLATDPSLLLLDEPFSALDYQTKLKLEDLVSTTLKKHQKTAVLVTHDIGEAIAMSDRIYLLSSRPGRLFQTFSVPDNIRAKKPLEARNDAGFQALFQQIWKELENVENEHANSP